MFALHASERVLSFEGFKEEAREWVDDGSLPLVDSALPFFLLDAHEEPATPGTLYLFGKVSQLSQVKCSIIISGSSVQGIESIIVSTLQWGQHELLQSHRMSFTVNVLPCEE